MSLEEILLDALRKGPGNPRQITERLVDRVRDALNRMAEIEKIYKSGVEGRGNEKIYSLAPPPKLPNLERRG